MFRHPSRILTRSRLVVAALAVLAVLASLAAVPGAPQATPDRPHRGLDALTALDLPAGEPALGVAVYPDGGPTPAQLAGLADLGLQTQHLEHLPVVLVRGLPGAMEAAVDTGLADDVYPNERLALHSRRTIKSMNADDVHEELGLTGAGVGVAVVDTGIDATHPDLANRVTHNMKLVGPEYLGLVGVEAGPDDGPGTLVIPVDQGPYNNSDIGYGHGTHVAGIIAADASADPELIGVAPGAELIGYSTGGESLYIWTILAAFNDVLEHHEDWNIRVVNNSWGGSFRTFDPDAPIHLATKALHDAGIVVTFSAGNSAEEMTINPWSVAPWVISVGSADDRANRSSFSSAGLMYDNAGIEQVDENGHVRYSGDQLGIYHPDVTGIGSNVLSTATPTGLLVNSPTPGGSTTASGTSMSSPHVAGLAALLLEARPDLTPDQVRTVLEVTSVGFRDESPFWQLGYGFVDAYEAATLVQRDDFSQALLDELSAARTAEVQAAREHRVLHSDHWVFTPQPGSVEGVDTRTFAFEVDPAATAIRASASFPATLGLVGVNEFDWQITVRDADGNVVLTSDAPTNEGTTLGHVELADVGDVAFGTWEVEIAGNLALSQPQILWGGDVSVVVTQLAPNE